MTHGVVWFRRDLRLVDNPAWGAATSYHDHVTALFVADPKLWRSGTAARQALLRSHLRALDDELTALGGRLCVLHGPPHEVLPSRVDTTQADAVYWNNDVTGASQKRDQMVEDALEVPVKRSWGTLVHPPGAVLTQKGTVSLVFTPFWKKWRDTPLDPWPQPGTASVRSDEGDGLPPSTSGSPRAHDATTDSDPLTAGAVLDHPTGHDELDAVSAPEATAPIAGGTDSADRRLARWLDGVDEYPDTHDRPDVPGTSQLSIDLKFGTLSPRAVLEEIGSDTDGRAAFVRQLAWRDWYGHLFHEIPHMVDQPMRPDYAGIAWRDDDEQFEAWKTGHTGYPVVDAGMRQLVTTGWMHNRVRMLTASFLVKHLLIDWTRGERYFRHLLLDADVPQNAGNWQWVAGTGPDAAPYFRIFNPVSQSQKFDPQGDYIRAYVPELAGLTAPAVHAPFEAAPLDLASGGVTLGDTYPWPIVDLAHGRERALAAYKKAKGD